MEKNGNGTLNINNETFYVEYDAGILKNKLTLQEKENLDLKDINNKLNYKLDETTLLVQQQEDTKYHIIQNYQNYKKNYEKCKNLFYVKFVLKTILVLY